MPRSKEPEPMVKVKLNLFVRDYERLKDLYPMQGPARVVRALVHAHVARIEAKLAPADIETLELDDLEIEDA